VFSVISSAIARRVKQSAFSAIDHTLGLLFGLVRGFVIACLLYLGITWALPDANQPQWIKEARSAPMLESGANTLRGMVPATLRSRAEATANEAAQKIDQARQADGAIRALTSPKTPDPPTQSGGATGSGGTSGGSGGTSGSSGTPNGTNSTDRRGLDRLIQQNSQQ
jgi:membrane protein required for colicin V production